jgi:hypothetical protein
MSALPSTACTTTADPIAEMFGRLRADGAFFAVRLA